MVFQFARDMYFRSDIYNRMLRRQAAPQIHALASNPVPGDPVKGAALLSGDMVLAARLRHLGAHPFAADLKSRRAQAELHGFDWLRDLAALSAPAARDGAAGLIRDWLRHFDRWDPLVWSPGTTASRALAWINHVDFVTLGGDPDLRAEIAGSAAAQLRHLAGRARDGGNDGDDVAPFTAGAALAAGSVALPGLDNLLEAGLSRLEAAADSGVLADGGHRSRAPETAALVLARLCEAQRALKAGRAAVPEFLSAAIARLAPAVKAMTLGDGGLAVFNGGTRGAPQEIAAILGAAGARAAAQHFPDWGFERLQAGTTTVIADAGGGGHRGNGAHAGALSFEMSAGRHRLVVNCGAHPDETTEWSTVLRSTAAHSTLAVNDTDALPPPGAPGEDIRVIARRNERAGSTLVQMGHEGYRRAFGIVHNRDLYLSGAGDDFRGKDTLVGGAGAFTLRFHLHPDVGASPLEGGGAVLLKLPGGKGWRFRCSGAQPVLEESVYLGDPAEPRRCQQIALRGDHQAGETSVRWSFLREGA